MHSGSCGRTGHDSLFYFIKGQTAQSKSRASLSGKNAYFWKTQVKIWTGPVHSPGGAHRFVWECFILLRLVPGGGPGWSRLVGRPPLICPLSMVLPFFWILDSCSVPLSNPIEVMACSPDELASARSFKLGDRCHRQTFTLPCAPFL